MGALRAALVATVSAACVSAYEPGALLRAPASVRADCLDLAVTPHADPALPASHVALRVDFGNRCARPVTLDLTRLAVTGVWPSHRAPLALVDPRREVEPAVLDAHRDGAETLEFAPVTDSSDAPAEVCVAFEGVVPGADAATLRCLAARPVASTAGGSPP